MLHSVKDMIEDILLKSYALKDNYGAIYRHLTFTQK